MEYAERDDLLDEIIDRFGELPPEVEMLWRLASIKGLCRLMRIRGINVRPGMLRITFGERANVNTEVFMKLLNANKNSMSFKNGKESQLLYKTNALKEEPLKWLEKTLPLLALGNKFNHKASN